MSNAKVLVGEELYKKRDELKEIYVDAERWETFYLDEEIREIWVKYHPYGEMQAGGPPELIKYEDYIKKLNNKSIMMTKKSENKQKRSIFAMLGILVEWVFFALGILIMLSGFSALSSGALARGVINILFSFPLLYPIGKVNSKAAKIILRWSKVIIVFFFYGILKKF